MRFAPLGLSAVLLIATSSARVLGNVPENVSTTSPEIAWSSLPSESLSRVPFPKSAPAALAQGERAEGVYVVRPKWITSNNRMLGATVVGSKKFAQELAAGNVTTQEHDVCVATAAMPALVDATSEIQAWSSSMNSQGSISWQAPGREDNEWTRQHRPLRVSAVHLERLLAGEDGSASLEYRDAWVDAVSLGTRPIRSGSVHLARVNTGPGGLAVYAARDGDLVHFVVQAGRAPSSEPGLANFTRSVSVNGFGGSDCGFLRVSLRTDDSDLATFTTTAITRVSVPPKAQDGSQPVRPRTATRRTLLVFASTTRSSADPEPVLSVALGWSGREEEFQF
jgi:hypothetical protein